MSIQEKRRARFEAIVAEHYYLKELPLNRHDGEYAESELQMAWEVFEATLDSVKIDLSKHHGGQAIPDSERMFLSDVRDAIEAAGLEVKP